MMTWRRRNHLSQVVRTTPRTPGCCSVLPLKSS